MKRFARVLAALLLVGSACAFASDSKPTWSNRFPFGGVNVATISATTTLNSGTSKPVQRYTVSGSDRNVVLPSESNSMGLYYWIGNVGASNNAVVKASDGSTTVVTVTPGYWGYVHCDGTTWYGSIIPTNSITALTVTTLTATNVNAVDIDAGASGTAGTVDVFPTTASKGRLRLAAVDSSGDFIATISNASLGQATVFSLPDPGAATETINTLATNQTLTGWKVFSAGYKRRAATQTVTDSTTLTADDTLVVTLRAAKKYQFRIVYYFTTVNSSGYKIDLNGGTATWTSIQGDMLGYNMATPALLAAGTSTFTAINTAIGITASGTNVKVVIEGGGVVNAAGTFAPKFAQNAETGAAESVIAAIDSFMLVQEMP